MIRERGVGSFFIEFCGYCFVVNLSCSNFGRKMFGGLVMSGREWVVDFEVGG